MRASVHLVLPPNAATLPHSHSQATHSTISLAIAQANDGDIIMVSPGEYAEQLNVDKSITIQPYLSGNMPAPNAGQASALVRIISSNTVGLRIAKTADVTIKNILIEQRAPMTTPASMSSIEAHAVIKKAPVCVRVVDAGKLKAENCRFISASHALMALHQGSITLNDCLIARSGESGIVVAGNASINARDLHIQDSRLSGVWALDKSRVELSNVFIGSSVYAQQTQHSGEKRSSHGPDVTGIRLMDESVLKLVRGTVCDVTWGLVMNVSASASISNTGFEVCEDN
jgi:hypothetical protein